MKNQIKAFLIALAVLALPSIALAQLTIPQGGTGQTTFTQSSIPFMGSSALRFATSSAFTFDSSLSKLTATNASTTNLSATNLSATTFCLSLDCRSAWPSGGSGSSTPSVGSAGLVQFASSTAGYFNATSTFFWDNANGRLGIGTSTPTSTLQVLSTTEQFRSGYSPSIYWNAVTDSSGRNVFTATGGLQTFRFTGDVGIGAAPVYALTVLRQISVPQAIFGFTTSEYWTTKTATGGLTTLDYRGGNPSVVWTMNGTQTLALSSGSMSLNGDYGQFTVSGLYASSVFLTAGGMNTSESGLYSGANDGTIAAFNENDNNYYFGRGYLQINDGSGDTTVNQDFYVEGASTFNGQVNFMSPTYTYGDAYFGSITTFDAQTNFSAPALFLPNSSAGTPSIGFQSDGNTGIFNPAADIVAFTTAGTEAMRITSGQLVGIGGTPVTAKLNVISTTEQLRLSYDTSNRMTTTVGSTGAVAFDAVGSGARFSFADALGVGTTTPSAKLAVTGTAGTGDIFMIASSTEAALFTVKSTGFVGIGTTTPATILSVAGTSTMRDIIPAGSFTGNMSAYSIGATAARWNAMWAGTYNVGTSTWSISATGPDRFGIFNAASAGGTERLSILNGGNVGIGTTTPGTTLSVNGTTTTTNIVIGSLSGILKAVGGAVTTALVNLASDVSGVLAIANGGTNISTYAAGDILYASATNVLSKLAIGTSGQVLTTSSGGAPTWSSPGGYALLLSQQTINNYADATTFYFGMPGGVITTLDSRNRIVVPKSGSVKSAYGHVAVFSTLGSSETATLYLRVNDTTDYLISNTITATTTDTSFASTTMDIPLNAGDSVILKFVTPTWVTNPQSATLNVTVFIE